MSFKNIYFDYKTNKIHLWEVFNNKTVKYEDEFENFYYIEDKTKTSPIVDIYGKSVIKEFGSSEKVKVLKSAGHYICESDISTDIKFLQERYKGIESNTDISNFNIAYLDIEIAVNDEFPKPEEAKYPINLITIKSSKHNTIATFGTTEYTKSRNDENYAYYYIPNELDMLTEFVQWFRKMKFDIVTGWNISSFDIPYIINRIKNLTKSGLEEKLSPINKIVKNKKTGEYSIPGISILDYLLLYKNFTFDNKPSYSLQAISMHELNEGKLDYEGTIHDIYKTDWNTFVDYNIQDVLLVEKIENKMKFINLTVTLCHQALIPFEKVFSSISVLTGYILHDLHKNNMVMPDKKDNHYDWWFHTQSYREDNGYLQNVLEGETTFEEFAVKGGHVEAYPGFYKYNISFDAESLYPTNIMMFNISPETKVVNPSPEEIKEKDLIKSAINKVYYIKKEGVLPRIVKKIFQERKQYKKMMFEATKCGDKVNAIFFDSQQHIRKIMINSLYGVLGNKHFHFYDVDNARAITRGGRIAVRYLAENTNRYFREVWHNIAHKYFPNCKPKPILDRIAVVLDTDSNYFNLEEVKNIYAPDMEFKEFANIMEHKVLIPFIKKIFDIFASKMNVANMLNFKREAVITKQFVLAKKKYIIEMIANEDIEYEIPKIKVKGVETVRSDTPMYNRKYIMDVIKFILDNLDKEKTLDMLRKIKKGFVTQKVEDISSVSGVKEYTKYALNTDYYVKNGLKFKDSTPIHNRASIIYNMLVKKYKLPYMSVADGTKIKYIYIDPKNQTSNNVIAFIGNYPKEFEQWFKIDFDLQFEKTFLSVIQRMFDVLQWGNIILTKNKLFGFAK